MKGRDSIPIPSLTEGNPYISPQKLEIKRKVMIYK